MTTWLFIAAAACVIIAGALIAVRGLTERPRSVRRFGLGLTFIICGLTTGLLVTGGSVPWPRAYVIVYPGGSDLSGKALAVALKALPQKAAVTFVQLVSPDSLRQNSTAAASWTTTRRALNGAPSSGWKAKLDSEAFPLLIGRDTWAVQIDKLAERLLRERPTAFGRPPRDTVLVVFSPVGVWNTVRGGAEGASEVLQRIAGGKPREYFVAQADDNQSPGYLTFELTREVLPTGVNPSRLTDQVFLHLVSPYESLDGRYTITATVDRPPTTDSEANSSPDNGEGLSATFDLGASDRTDANGLTLSFRLGDKLFFPIEKGFREGFHRFSMQLSFRSRSSYGGTPRVYRSVRYIPAADRNILVVGPTNSLGQLADQGWNEILSSKTSALSVPRNFGDMLSRYFAPASDYAAGGPTFNRVVQTERRAGIAHVRYNSYSDCLQMGPLELMQKVGSTPVVVLVEPTVGQLNDLDKTLTSTGRSISQLIQDGLHLLVIGPPPQKPESPAWLPAYSATTPDGTRAQVVHRDPRLYFAVDNSRPMWFRHSSDDATAIEYQSRIVDKIVQKLGNDRAAVQIGTGVNGAQLDPKQNGRSPFAQGARSTNSLAVFAPVIIYAPFDSKRLAQVYSDEKSAAQHDAAPASIQARISALSDENAVASFGAGFRPLTQGDLFPCSTVVFFVSDIPQTTDTNILLAARLTTGRQPNESVPFGLLTPPANLSDLVRAGVRVHLVVLETGDTGKYYQHATGKKAFDLRSHISDTKLAAQVKVHSLKIDQTSSTVMSQVEGIADKVALDVSSRLAPKLTYEWSGRALDDRVALVRASPESAFRLTSGSDVPPPHAVVRDEDWIRQAVGQPSAESPMVLSRSWGDGSVTALAYSPAALDMWLADVTTPPSDEHWRWRGKDFGLQGIDGWGIQRIIDMLDLTASGGRRPTYPVVTAAREMPDGSTIQFDLSMRASASTDLAGMRVWIDGQAYPCTLVRTDPVLQRATVQFQTEKAVTGFCRTVTSASAEKLQLLGSTSWIFLSLRPAPPLGRNAFETLGQVACISGGAILQDSGSDGSGTDIRTPEQQLQFRQPAAWLASLALLVLLGLIFSPLLRPWTAVRLLLARYRAGASTVAGERSRSPLLDVEATLVEFGSNPGPAAAIRQAGLPAGQRDYEVGDALSTARPLTLLAFTDVGKRMGLPQRLPTVRLRHASRSLEAVILIDCSPSLRVPEFSAHPTKVAYVRAVVHLIAGVVWIQGGSIRVDSLQRSRLDQDAWPPGSNALEIDAYLETLFSSHRESRTVSRFLRPDALEPGSPVFLISDLISMEDEALRHFTSGLRQEDNQLRVVHILDPDEYRLIGLGRFGPAVVDRGAWSEGDVARAYRTRTEQFRRDVEQDEGRFASITTDHSIASAMEILIERGVLD